MAAVININRFENLQISKMIKLNINRLLDLISTLFNIQFKEL